MTLIEAVNSAFQNYFNFKDRSRRSEYWYFTLFLFLAGFVFALVDIGVLGYAPDEFGPASGLFSLATLIPGISVSVRRLHDMGRSGWFLLLAFIPLIGWIVLIYWCCQPTASGSNRFGDGPLPAGTAAA